MQCVKPKFLSRFDVPKMKTENIIIVEYFDEFKIDSSNFECFELKPILYQCSHEQRSIIFQIAHNVGLFWVSHMYLLNLINLVT